MADKPALTPSQYNALSDALKAKAQSTNPLEAAIKEVRYFSAGFDKSGEATQALISEEAVQHRAKGAKVYQEFLDALPKPAQDSLASARALTTGIESTNIRTPKDREMVEATAIELAAKVYSRGDIENNLRGWGGATRQGWDTDDAAAKSAVQAFDATKSVIKYFKEADVEYSPSDISSLAQAGKMVAADRERGGR